MDLESRARGILKSLDIEELNRYMIRRGRDTNWPGHIIVMYPPFKALGPISQEQIFTDYKADGLSFYLHLPFCTKKCTYCHYISYPCIPSEEVERYVEYLKKELALYDDLIGNITANTVYLGGGTPSYLSPRQLEDLLCWFGSEVKTKEGAEFTVECSPETLTPEKLEVMARHGINRISIGAQAFEDPLLKNFGRAHDAKAAVKAFNFATAAGFDNINIDIIYGLPDQTSNGLLHTLKVLKDLSPASITAYQMRIDNTTPGWQVFQNEPERFQNEMTLALMNIMIMEFLKELGYMQDPVYYFANSRQYLHKQQYSKYGMGELVGLGVSAYSYANNVQYMNTKKLHEYYAQLDGGRLPISVGQRLDVHEQMCRTMVFGIKRLGGISDTYFRKSFGRSLYEVFSDEINFLKALKLIDDSRNGVKLTYKGILYPGKVAKTFYSRAVMDKTETPRTPLSSPASSRSCGSRP